MSDSIFKIFPTDPAFIPTPDQVSTLKTYFSTHQNQLEWQINISDEINFIDPGDNFETIRCPLCDELIDGELWQDMMDQSYQSGFTNLNILTPCCQKRSSLNHLNYHFPAGFARFVIEILNPSSLNQKELLAVVKQITSTALKTTTANI